MRVLLCLFVLTLGSGSALLGASALADRATLAARPSLATNWVDLLRSGKQTELERQGEKAGATGIAAELGSGERARVLAALQATPGAADSWALLGTLAALAGDADRGIAIQAAQLAAELSHDLDAFTLEEQEIPRHDLREWQLAWARVAIEKTRWVDIRVHALEAAAALTPLLAKSDQGALPWDRFITDADEEMRAAAIQLAPHTKTLEGRAPEMIKGDTSDLVALHAGQRLCGPLGSARPLAPTSVDVDTLGRLQKLAANKSLSLQSRVDLANCLARDPSDESRRALATLVQQSTPSLRKALVALTQSSSP